MNPFTPKYLSRYGAACWGPAIPFVVAAAAGLQVVSAISQGRAARSADKFNAAVAAQNASIAEQQTQSQLDQQKIDTYRRLSGARAAYGASGVTPDGSPMDVLADSFQQATMTAQNIAYNGKVKAAGYTNTANLETAQAADAGPASYINAASSALVGGAKTYQSGVENKLFG